MNINGNRMNFAYMDNLTLYGSGNAILHLHFLPFGEDWVDQRNTSWNAPYTFSGKEKDAETGYGYFGARNYDSGLSIWLSIDPMSDKNPSVSPYNYYANNPLMLVDPKGEDEYDVTEIGKITGKANSDNDVFYMVDSEGNRTGNQLRFEGKIVESEFSMTSNEGYKANCVEISNLENAEKVFPILPKKLIFPKTKNDIFFK